MRDISAQYQHLTGDERFRLFVEAMGRSDEQEIDRLEFTCPKHHYVAQDSDYTTRKSLFTVFALSNALLRMRLDGFAQLSMTVWCTACNDDDTADTADRALDQFQEAMRLVASKRQAWERFCADLHVDPDGVTAPLLGNYATVTSAAEKAMVSLCGEDWRECDEVTEAADSDYESLIASWRSKQL